MIGVVSSAFGLSAFFFSLIAKEIFPGETRAFLTVLMIGTGVPVLVGTSALRLRVKPIAGVEERLVENEETSLQSGEEHTIYGERNTPAHEDPVIESGIPNDPARNAGVYGLELFKTTDFWVIFGIIAMCELVLFSPYGRIC